MKRTIILMLAAIALLVSLVVALADNDKETPNDPREKSDANACYTGGSMAGKCKLDDQLWIADWYEIRFEYGLISREQVPDQYQWLLTTPQNEPSDNSNPATTPEP